MSLLDQKISRRRFVQATVATGVSIYLADNVIERVEAMAELDPERFEERPFQIALDRSMIPLSWRVELRPDERYFGVSPSGFSDGYWTTFVGPEGEEFRAVFDARYAAHNSFTNGSVVSPADVGILSDPVRAVIRQHEGLTLEDMARVRVEDLQIVRTDRSGNIVSGMFADDERLNNWTAREMKPGDPRPVTVDLDLPNLPFASPLRSTIPVPEEVKRGLLTGIRLDGEWDYSEEGEADEAW